jgi:hypothetical protein
VASLPRPRLAEETRRDHPENLLHRGREHQAADDYPPNEHGRIVAMTTKPPEHPDQGELFRLADLTRRTGPRRVKIEGDLFHGRIPDGAVYVGRAAPGLPRSSYANPYPVKGFGIEASLQHYRAHLGKHPELIESARRDLAGCNLACWCALNQPCHADILLEILR